jgi:hypothetical protein
MTLTEMILCFVGIVSSPQTLPLLAVALRGRGGDVYIF